MELALLRCGLLRHTLEWTAELMLREREHVVSRKHVATHTRREKRTVLPIGQLQR